MPSYLADAAIGLGLAKGGEAGTSARQADRADARARKEAGDQKLARLRATKPTDKDLSNLADIQSLEIENLKAENKSALRQNNERMTYSAFERYDASGEVRHLNTMLTDLKSSGSQLYQDTVRFDTLTEADKELMDKSGSFSNDMVLNDPNVKGSIVKATKADGTTELVNLDTIKSTTRYNVYADKSELDRQKAAQEVKVMDSLGYTDGSEASREAFRRAVDEVGDPKAAGFQEAYTKHYDKLKAAGPLRGGSKSNGLTEKEAEAERRVSMQGISPGEPGYNQAYSEAMSDINTEYSRPSPIRKQEAADEVRAQLDELDILGKPYTEMNLKERAKVEPLISKLESFSDAKLTTADKATLERINELTHLGDAASELTDEQTGLIDRVFRQVGKYISDNTEGVQQEAAYAAYRNTVRHALYGSVLTPGETKSFVEQFGSLGQQRGPILAQLKTSLEQVKSNYETLVQTNDPYVIAYRTGMTANELQDVTEALDERIDMVSDAMSGKSIRNTTTPPAQSTTTEQVNNTTLSDSDRQGLDAIRRSID